MAGYIGSSAAVSTSGVERKKTFAITTSTTALTGVSYTPNFVHVFHNGIRLVDGTDYTATNGTSVTLVNAAESGDEVVVVSYATFSPADAYTKAESDAEFLNDPASVITVSGSNVGIGTSSPSSQVDILGSSSRIRLDGSAASFQILSRNTADSSTNALTFDADTYTFNRAGSTKMTLDSSGNVGIGTGSPVNNSNRTTLGLQGAWGGQLDIMVGSTVHAQFGTDNFSSGQSARIQSQDGIVFKTNGDNLRMLIDSSGRLLLNTGGAYTYAQNRFQVNAGSGQYAAMFMKDNTDDEVVTLYRHAGATGGTVRTLLYFMSGGGSEVGKIQINGSSTSYVTTSDYRLKEDVQPMTGASDRVLALKPCNFAWKDGGIRVDGFLAHEAQDVVSEAVTGAKDAVKDEEYEVTPAVYEDVVIPAVLDEDGNELEAERTERRLVTEAVMGTRSVPDYQGIDQSKLVPLLTAALQEALTEIAALKVRVAALEVTP